MEYEGVSASILERIPVAFFALDRKSRVTYLNERTRELFRNRAGGPLRHGQHLWTRIPELRDTWFHHFTAWVTQAGIPIQVDEYWPPLKGRVEAHIHPARDGLSVLVQKVPSGTSQGHPPSREEAMNLLRPVAHELRTPLHAIVLSAERLLKLEGERSDEEADTGEPSHVHNILRAAEHATRLTHDLHDLARLESGTLTLQRESHAVADLVEEVVQIHQVVTEDKGVRLETEVPENAGGVLVDRKRVLQVFSNLLENSVRHTEPGGAITVRVSGMDEDRNHEVRFSVTDTGSGIPLERLPHLFEALATGSHGRGGGGLGLTIAQAIVQAHGGTLWVEDAGEEGSTLSFTLPLARERECATAVNREETG